MNEYHIGYATCGSLVGLAIAALLYMAGGRYGKWKRRYVASFVIALTVWLSSLFLGTFSFWLLLIYPLLIGQFCMGYGEAPPVPKWIKRVLITLAGLVIGGLFCWLYGGITYVLLGLQFLVGIGTVVFAFKNPIHPAAEEPLVMMMNNLLIIFYPFVTFYLTN